MKMKQNDKKLQKRQEKQVLITNYEVRPLLYFGF